MTRCSSARTGSTLSRTRSKAAPISIRSDDGWRRREHRREVMEKKAALVIGAGDALGSAIARRFAREGFIACVARRNGEKLAPLVEAIRGGGGTAVPFGVDARKEEAMAALVERIEGEIAPIEVAAFNIGANVRFPILETTSRVYFKVWEMGC